MMKVANTILFAAACCMSIPAFASEKPSVRELLDKYAETMDKIQRSFIIKNESSGKFSYRTRLSKRSGKTHSLCETRFDGKHISQRTLKWGDLNRTLTNVPRNKALYRSYLWDGKQYITYREGYDGKYPSIVIINRDSGHDMKPLADAMNGNFRGDLVRVDSILRQARNVSVQDERDEIKGSACYVIDAVTEHGKYTLWIDPNHGYNIAKAMVRKKEHQLFSKKPPSRNYVSLEVIENVRFQQIDGVWVSMEADFKYDGNYTDGYFSKSKGHIKRTEVILNPDHNALGSFVPDDIKNGSRVHIVQVPGMTYTWQRDKKFIMDEWDGRTRYVPEDWSIRAGVGRPLPEFEGIDLDINIKDLSDKAILLCFFDMNQRPSQNCIQKLNTRVKELTAKDVAVAAVQASKVDKAKLNNWIKKYNVTFPVGMVKGDQEKIRFTWGVRSLPWLILTDKWRIVRVEGFGIDMLEEKIKQISQP